MSKNRGRLSTVGIVMLVVFVTAGLCLILLTILFSPLSPPRQGLRATEKDFQKNEASILIVRDYLAELTYENIYLSAEMMKDGIMSVSDESRSIGIDDAEVMETLLELMRSGRYFFIGKRNNYLYFGRWAEPDGMIGFAYSSDGSVPRTVVQHPDRIEPLTEDGWFFYERLSAPEQSTDDMEREFQKYSEQMEVVRDYLDRSEYRDISVEFTHRLTGEQVLLNVSQSGDILIDDPEAAEAISALFECGYLSIHKAANSICFTRWAGGNVSKGVVYTIDGCVPDDSAFDFLTRLEPLRDDGWYYYEENFDTWRTRNNSGQ